MAYNKKLLFSKVYKSVLGFPHSSVGRDLPIMQETWGLSLGQEDPLGEGNGNPLQYSCLENPHGQQNLAGYSPWGHKESDRTEAT